MLLFWICVIVSLICNLWLVAKIRRVSWLYAIVSFVFFPAAIFFMFSHWGDEEHDIKVPFVITVIASLIGMYQMDKLEAEYGYEDEDEEVSWYQGESAGVLVLEARARDVP